MALKTPRKLFFLICFLSLFTLFLFSKESSIFAKKISVFSSKIIGSVERAYSHKKHISIAIIDLEDLTELTKNENLGKIVSDLMITNFVKNKAFTVVERKKLGMILDELNLSRTGFIDSDTAHELGKLVAADIILCGSTSEISHYFDINIRVIDVEKSSILTSEVLEIKQADFYGKLAGPEKIKKVRKRIQKNLDALYLAIHYYSLKYKTKFNLIFPQKLDDLVPEFLKEIPDPIRGKWIYDSRKGTIANSAYSEIKPTIVTPNFQPILDMAKRNALLGRMRQIKVAVEMYCVEYGDYPESLDILVNERFLFEIPDPYDGEWIYDPKTGTVKHTLIKDVEF